MQSRKCSGLLYLQALMINLKNWKILCINCLKFWDKSKGEGKGEFLEVTGCYVFHIAFLFFLKHLYWSMIALQWCVSFCCITKWISYMYTFIAISPPSCISHIAFLTYSVERVKFSDRRSPRLWTLFQIKRHGKSPLHPGGFVGGQQPPSRPTVAAGEAGREDRTCPQHTWSCTGKC